MNLPEQQAILTVALPERVNDFAPLFVMNLLRKAVVVSG
jgi:hypothetical protein